MATDAEAPTLPLAEREASAGTYGRFVSLGVIGRGGMGLVLRARDPELARDVAIKVLAPTASADGAHAADRLRREAQAMAQAAHPNVVPVYDVGRIGDAAFLVMALVEGETLGAWLQGRGWREVVTAFVACGRGLAAAHAVGMVHRDFKPANVLVGADQRPQVTDFGLVASGVVIGDRDVGAAALGAGLSIDGAVVGTPAYMAPEQWTGGPIDARTDQFAFCVALWEALFGERPFAGDDVATIRAAVLTGEVRSPPRDRGIPADVEAIVRRGLAFDRAARWPSMATLLAALDRPRRRRWPWLLGGAGVAAALAAAVAVPIATRARAEPCPDPRAELVGVWDPTVASRVRDAFARAAPQLAAAVLARIEPQLDGYAQRWRTATIAACRATNVAGTQSAALLDQRMACLQRHRAGLAAVTTRLVDADRGWVIKAIDAVAALADLDTCADRDQLLAAPLPTEPRLRARIAAIDADILASEASRFDGKPADRQARAAAAVAAARPLGYQPLLVRALLEQAAAAAKNADAEATIATLREAIQVAAEAHDDLGAARGWLRLLTVMSNRRRLDEAAALEPMATAAVARAGNPPVLRNRLQVAIGTRLLMADEFDAAIGALREALASAPDTATRGIVQLQLAQAYDGRADPDQARPFAEQALASNQDAYGPDHPQTANALYVLGSVHVSLGHRDERVDRAELARAEAYLTRALAIREIAFAPGHREIANTVDLLATTALNLGDIPRARALYERAIAIYEAGGADADAGLSQTMLARLVADQDGVTAARPLFDAGLARLAAAGRADSITYIEMEANYVEALVAGERFAEAAPHVEHVVEIARRRQPDSLASYLELAAACARGLGRTDQAIAQLEQAVSACAASSCASPEDATFALGALLVESRRDPSGGRALIADATRLATEHGNEARLAAIAAWRARHR